MSATAHGSDSPEAEEEGGLINLRGVLGGVEYFRWFIIKSVGVVFVGMALCLALSNVVVEILRWPLQQKPKAAAGQTVWLQWGMGKYKELPMPTNHLGQPLLQSGRGNLLQLTPVTFQGREVLGLTQLELGAEDNLAFQKVSLNNYGPTGAFVVAFQIAFFGGLIIASPVIFFFLAQFLSPLLARHPDVRDNLGRWMSLAGALFLAGILFCYFVLLRVSLFGSVGFAHWMNFHADEWGAENYIGFVCKFMLGMGIGFQLPVVILLLVKVGILNHYKLVRARVYWIVLNLVMSAFITPDGSPLTMLLMAAPLWILYEVSLLVARSWERKAARMAV